MEMKFLRKEDKYVEHDVTIESSKEEGIVFSIGGYYVFRLTPEGTLLRYGNVGPVVQVGDDGRIKIEQ